MMTMYFIYFLISGLVVGSFLNVVISRMNQDKSFWQGRSVCPSCRNKIAWIDNVPVLSFILLKGKCRSCQKKISWQYPLVEISTALIFLWLYLEFGLSSQFFVYLIFVCFLVVIFVYDLLHYQILDRVSVPAMIVGFILSLYLGLGIKNLLLGGIIGGGFFAIQYFGSKGKWVGDGDIRLGVVMGFMLGWKLLLVALFLSYIIGSIFGLTLIALGKKKISSAVPFGPFLTIGTLVSLVYGQDLLSWYINLIF